MGRLAEVGDRPVPWLRGSSISPCGLGMSRWPTAASVRASKSTRRRRTQDFFQRTCCTRTHKTSGLNCMIRSRCDDPRALVTSASSSSVSGRRTTPSQWL